MYIINLFQVHNIFINKFYLEELIIPKEDEITNKKARLSIYVSRNYCECENLLIIIPGTRTQAGIWSRSLCIDEGLNIGSMIPYVEKALQYGYGIIISNPNSNFIKEVKDGMQIKVPIQYNESPQNHIVYLYDKYIRNVKSENILCVAYAYGGVILKNLICVYNIYINS